MTATPRYSVAETQPSSPVVTLAQARHHLRLDSLGDTAADADVDEYVRSLVLAAAQMCEAESRRRFVSRPVTLRLEGFPACGPVRIPVTPVLAVTAVTYADAGGTVRTLDPALYAAWTDHVPPLLSPAAGAAWPATQAGNPAAVTVALVAGYGPPQAVPELAKQAVRLTLMYWHEHRGDGRDPNTAARSLGLPHAARRLLDLLGSVDYQ